MIDFIERQSTIIGFLVCATAGTMLHRVIGADSIIGVSFYALEVIGCLLAGSYFIMMKKK